jgi:hypothetical protein
MRRILSPPTLQTSAVCPTSPLLPHRLVSRCRRRAFPNPPLKSPLHLNQRRLHPLLQQGPLLLLRLHPRTTLLLVACSALACATTLLAEQPRPLLPHPRSLPSGVLRFLVWERTLLLLRPRRLVRWPRRQYLLVMALRVLLAQAHAMLLTRWTLWLALWLSSAVILLARAMSAASSRSAAQTRSTLPAVPSAATTTPTMRRLAPRADAPPPLHQAPPTVRRPATNRLAATRLVARSTTLSFLQLRDTPRPLSQSPWPTLNAGPRAPPRTTAAVSTIRLLVTA